MASPKYSMQECFSTIIYHDQHFSWFEVEQFAKILYTNITIFNLLFFSGVLNTVGALQGFIGSYAAGYILHVSESWATVFCSTASIAFFGWTMFTCLGSGKPIL